MFFAGRATNWGGRAGAAALSIGCVVLSVMQLLKIIGLGSAIGAWIGLKDYEQALADARHAQGSVEIRLIIPQILGGVFAFITLRRNLGLLWSPLFVVGFFGITIATAIFWICFEITTGRL